MHLNVQILTVTEYLQLQCTYSISIRTVSVHPQYTNIYSITYNIRVPIESEYLQYPYSYSI